jgi:catechol 2,3-dioxygenase-like lactoylglutathione lyase family enzyme
MAIDLRGMTPLLQVFDMPTSLHFYRDVLGFELLASSGGDDRSDWVLLRRAGVELMLNAAYESGARPSSPDTARVASHSDVGLFFGCQDIDAAYAHFVAEGVKATPPNVAPYGMRQLYVTDPDGYVVCFQWPVSEESQSQWRKWYGQ